MLARLFGRSNIYKFRIEIFGDIKTFDFLKVTHHQDGEVLCQVTNITRDGEKLIGDCKVIGFRENRVLKSIRTPFPNDAEIEVAQDKFIEKTIGLNTNNNDFIGMLEHHSDLKISLDLKKTITKHMAILAKSGAGKSYTVGVILEEVMKKNIPIIILDPHNEYASIKYPNTNKRDVKRLEGMGLKPEGFLNRVKEFSPDTKINPQSEPVTLDLNKMKPQDLIESMPQKLTPAQQSVIFNVLSTLNNRVNFDELIFHISNEESNAKWSLITLLETLKKLNIYSSNPTPLNKLVKHKQTSIISLKGVEPYVQETFVAGLLRDLFEARKREEIPPFLLVLEEAHNFCVTKDTEILTEDGPCQISKIKDCNIISFSHLKGNFELDKIKKIHPKRKAEIIKLTTGSGKEIKCTKDHPFWNGDRYVNAEYLDKVAIPLIDNYGLKEKEVQARLFGALYSDGWVSVNKQVGFSGKYEDMLRIKEDLTYLGLKSSKVSTFENKKASSIKTSGGVVSVSGKGSSISCSKRVYDYFVKLGSIVGEKVKQETKIPSWIKNGSKQVKAEFLAGLMGGDGLKLLSYGRNFYVTRLYFTKLKEIKDLGDKYAQELMELFKDLGVEVILSYRKGNIRKKDGKESLKFIITISNKDRNLINFLENVGYRYNSEKEGLAKKALIYLKIKQGLIDNQEILRKRALRLQKEKGWGKIKIGNELSLPSSLIAKWIYKGKNYSKSAGLTKFLFPKYIDWEVENADDNFIYDEVLFQEDLGEDWVYNITTGNQNYIANNMLLHNCPEKGMGELKSSKVIRTLAGEGRKFGVGLCVITQRPAKVDKNVISQCTTQILLKITNPNDLRSVIASSEGVDNDSENEIQKLNIGTCLLTGVIDIPLKVNIRPRISKHGGETVDITMPYEQTGRSDDPGGNISYDGEVGETKAEEKKREEVSDKPKGEHSEFIQYVAPEIELDDAKVMLDAKEIESQLVPAALVKVKTNESKEVSLLFDKTNKQLIKTLFPFEGFLLNGNILKLTDSEKKLLKVILTLNDSFNPAELLIKTDMMFNEILRVCDSLAAKQLLNKNSSEFEIGTMKFAKELENMNYYGQQKFEEVSYDVKEEENITNDEIKQIFEMFGSVDNIKDMFILKYVGK